MSEKPDDPKSAGEFLSTLYESGETSKETKRSWPGSHKWAWWEYPLFIVTWPIQLWYGLVYIFGIENLFVRAVLIIWKWSLIFLIPWIAFGVFIELTGDPHIAKAQLDGIPDNWERGCLPYDTINCVDTSGYDVTIFGHLMLVGVSIMTKVALLITGLTPFTKTLNNEIWYTFGDLTLDFVLRGFRLELWLRLGWYFWLVFVLPSPIYKLIWLFLAERVNKWVLSN